MAGSELFYFETDPETYITEYTLVYEDLHSKKVIRNAGLGGSGAGEVDRGRRAHVARRGREPPHRPVKTLQEYLAHKKQRPLKTLQ